MAASITLPNLLFTSSLQTLTVHSEEERVNVQIFIKVYGSDTFRSIWDQDYYTYLDKVDIIGVSQIVQNQMQEQCVADIQIILTGFESLEVSEYFATVIFCSLETSFSATPGNTIEDFLASRMLMSSRFYRVGRNTPIQASFFGGSGTAALSYRYRLSEQEFGTFQNVGGSYPSRGLNVRIATNFEEMNRNYSDSYGDFCECAIYPVNSPKAAVIFVHDPELDNAPVFMFRNCFGAGEFVALPAVITDKTDVNSQEASIAGIPTAYDIEISRKYEVSVGPLSFDEIGIFRQLVTSDTVRIRRESLRSGSFVWRDILISDISCEFSDNPEEPQTAKFTFRYKSAASLLDIVPASNIFDDNFNHSFD